MQCGGNLPGNAENSEHELHLAAQLAHSIQHRRRNNGGRQQRGITESGADSDTVYAVKGSDTQSATTLTCFNEAGRYRDVSHYIYVRPR